MSEKPNFVEEMELKHKFVTALIIQALGNQEFIKAITDQVEGYIGKQNTQLLKSELKTLNEVVKYNKDGKIEVVVDGLDKKIVESKSGILYNLYGHILSKIDSEKIVLVKKFKPEELPDLANGLSEYYGNMAQTANS